MQCPVDGQTLLMSERSGVEIDYCPQCRGVWLDRGELDKLIERSLGAGQPDSRPDHPRESDSRGFDPRQLDPRSKPYGSGKRKSSWLSEIFD